MDAPTFAEAVGQVARAASRDEARPMLTGVLLEVSREGLTLVATDSYRLAIRELVAAGTLVVASGGGGIPVVAGEDGATRGVEGVVDKDLAAVVLARAVGAEALLLLTDVAGVERDFGSPAARPIRLLTREEAGALLAALPRTLRPAPPPLGAPVRARVGGGRFRRGTMGVSRRPAVSPRSNHTHTPNSSATVM